MKHKLDSTVFLTNVTTLQSQILYIARFQTEYWWDGVSRGGGGGGGIL